MGIGSLPKVGLDKALGLAVGFERVLLRVDVANAHSLAKLIKDFGAIARPVVCHHALDLDLMPRRLYQATAALRKAIAHSFLSLLQTGLKARREW